jgi:hypothetical protein
MPNQNQLDAIALLKADHREVEDLFAKFNLAIRLRQVGLR